jgi:hypothetical protein
MTRDQNCQAKRRRCGENRRDAAFSGGHPATQKSGRQDLSLSACAKVSYWQPFRYPLEILEISHWWLAMQCDNAD